MLAGLKPLLVLMFKLGMIMFMAVLIFELNLLGVRHSLTGETSLDGVSMERSV